MLTRRTQETSMFGAITGVWWLFLLTGIAWPIIGLIVLRFDTTSIATVGALLGVVFLIAGLNEGMIAVVRPSWKWATSRSGSCGRGVPCVRQSIRRVLGARVDPRLPARPEGKPGHHRLRDDEGSQRVLVARSGDRDPGAPAGVLGIAAAFPGASRADPHLGGIPRPVPRQQRDRFGVPDSQGA